MHHDHSFKPFRHFIFNFMYTKDFPILKNAPELVFLDSASSAQKPQYVINAISEYLSRTYSNIHR